MEGVDEATITATVKDLLSKAGGKEGLNYLELVTFAMSVVESISGKKQLTGEEKKQLAIKIVPLIIDILVDVGKITSEEGENLKRSYQEQANLIGDFIEVAIAISKNPAVINAGKWISREGGKVCRGCIII